MINWYIKPIPNGYVSIEIEMAMKFWMILKQNLQVNFLFLGDKVDNEMITSETREYNNLTIYL